MPILSRTFDHYGGELNIEEHDVTITVPQLAVSKGDKVEVQACASLVGPYKLPDGYDLVSVVVCIEADYRFNKLIKVTIPHFAAIENLDQSFDVVILTADSKDIVLNENGDFVLQMHESVYDYQYEVNDSCCVYYTNHFCSKCLARRRYLIFRLFNWLTLSAPREVNYPKTRITVFFCVPDDYASADEMLIELCICYSFRHCLQVCVYTCVRFGFAIIRQIINPLTVRITIWWFGLTIDLVLSYDHFELSLHALLYNMLILTFVHYLHSFLVKLVCLS